MASQAKKILIIGAQGYIGSLLYQYYKSLDADTLGTSRRSTKDFVYCDLEMPNLSFLDSSNTSFSIGIICAAIPNIAKCEQSPKETFAQNVLGTLNLVQQLVKRNIKPIIFSSDIVFDGTQNLYIDESKPKPLNTYGYHKALLEELIPKLCDDYLIIRLSKTYSVFTKDQTFLHSLAQRLLNREPLKAASDLIFNPIHIHDVIKALDLLIDSNSCGIYNLTSNESSSWYQLALQIANALKINSESIQEVSIDEFGEGTTRPKNLNVQPKKFLQEFPHFQFTKLEENIKNLAQLYTLPPQNL